MPPLEQPQCPECKQTILNYHYKVKKASDNLSPDKMKVISVVEISCWNCGHIFSVTPIIK